MAQWDPRSYLAQAAAEHFLAVDVNATATTSTDYYEAIASHLEATDRHRAIEAAITQQRPSPPRQADNAPAWFDVDVGAAAADVNDFSCAAFVATHARQIEQDAAATPTAAGAARPCLLLRGTAFNMPFSVAIEAPEDAAASTESQRTYAVAIAAVVANGFADAGARYFVAEYKAATKAASSSVVQDSDLQRFNDTEAVCTPVSVAPPVARLAGLCQWVGSVSSEARYDPTCGRALAIWRRALLTEKRKPTAEELGDVWAATGFTGGVGVDVSRSTLTKLSSPATALDFGSLAKGATVDAIFEALQSRANDNKEGATCGGLLVEWGGDLRAAGVHPLLRRPWVVGICQPPSLNELYRAWHAGEPLPEPTFRKALRLPRSGAAVAASGDYRQLHKYGFTNLMNPAAKEPLKALAHTVSGATAVCPTCAEADAVATALVLEQSLEASVRLAMRIRQRCDDKPESYQLADPDDDEQEETTTAVSSWTPSRGVRLMRYYLSERNHDAFVTDEDDEAVGAGDEERRRQCDKLLNRDAAVHAVSQERATLTKKRGLHVADGNGADGSGHASNVGASSQHKRDKEAAQAPYLAPLHAARTMLQCRPSQLWVAVTPSGAIVRRHEANAQRFHAVLLSSVIVLPTVARCTAAASSNAATADPVGHVTFNVMTGSALFNHVREPGFSVALHMVSVGDAHHAAAMRANHSRWMASVTDEDVPLPWPAPSSECQPFVVVLRELRRSAFIARVSDARVCGDHLVVTAGLHVLPDAQAQERQSDPQSTASLAPLYKCLGRSCYIAGGSVPALTAPRGPGTDAARWAAAAPLATGGLATVGLLYFSHRSYGKVGLPVRGLTLCSESPPVLSCYAVHSAVAEPLLYRGGDGQVAWSSGCTLAFLGGGADTFVEPKHRDMGGAPTGAGSTAADEVEERAERFFSYIPFPSFRPAPGLALALKGDIRDAAVVEPPAKLAGESGGRIITLLVALRPVAADAIEWTDFGRRLADLASEAVVAARAPPGSHGDSHEAVDLPLLTYDAAGGHQRMLAPLHDA